MERYAKKKKSRKKGAALKIERVCDGWKIEIER